MRQKYWFTRSLSKTKDKTQQTDNTTINNRSRNQKVIFYNENIKKQLAEINQNAKKINDFLGNLKQKNRLYHEVNIDEGEMKNEVRCLKHNSIIILYCFSDNRLLCSNCVYGSSEHSKHRVHQAKAVHSRIEQVLNNNQKMIRLKGLEINGIRSQFQDIQKKIENLKQERLEQLDKELEEYSALLSTYYEKNKKKLIQTFEATKQEVNCFIEQMKQLGKNIKYEHSLHAVRYLHLQEVMDELSKISRLIPPHKMGQDLVETLNKFGKTAISSFRNGFSGISK